MEHVALRAIPFLLGVSLVIGCTVESSDDDDSTGGSSADTGGSSADTGGGAGEAPVGAGGTSGGAGAPAAGGAAGAAAGGDGGEAPGLGGAAGSAGEVGSAGAGATAGQPAVGGEAGQAGSPESGGAAGQGQGGTAPTGGAAGQAGTPGTGGVSATHTISGALQVGDSMFVDSDTLGPDNAFDTNDSTAPQLIGNPSNVGGYIGPVSGSNDDVEDWYEVQLTAGQVITLYIGTVEGGGAMPNLDLTLYEDTGGGSATQVDSSWGTGPVEAVTATTTATHFIVVDRPPSDTTSVGLYTMTVGQDLSPATAQLVAEHKLDPLWPAAEGEALVTFVASAQTMSDQQARAQFGITSMGRTNRLTGHRRVQLDLPRRVLRSPDGLDRARDTVRAIQRLRRNPLVAHAEPNYYRYAFAPAPDDPHFNKQWHYRQINLLDAWDNASGQYPDGTYTDHNSVIVAVLDTGIKANHPDFEGQLVPGFDFVSSLTIAGDGDGPDDDPDDPGDGAHINDSSWHGTHVAGTIAAATNNGEGCAGVAPAAKIMPVRVLGRGGGLSSDIIDGIEYAAGIANPFGDLPARRADIISMSLGGAGLSALTADAVAEARMAGVIVIAAAGNSNQDASNVSPAAEPGVVGVSAVDIERQKATYSNYGTTVIDVAAPGGQSFDQNFDGLPDNVFSLLYANNGQTLYGGLSGTSMACPHVSGVAALMKSVYPDLTPAEFDNMLAAGDLTENLSNANYFGNGLINANKAVNAAIDAAGGGASTEPVLTLSARDLDFGLTEDALPITIENAGGGDLTFDDWAADQTWITDILPGTGYTGIQMVEVDRTGLSDGIYSGNITIETNGGTATVRIRVVVGTQAVAGGDVGVVYVVLVDPDTLDAPANYPFPNNTVATSVSDGFAYTFADLPQGTYRMYAGTDLDNNGFINDDGEAFGAFPLLSNPETITVTAPGSGYDFPVEFLLNLQSTASEGPSVVRGGQRISRLQ